MAGCSSTNRAYYDTLKAAFSSSESSLTVEQIRASRADLMAVKSGDRDSAIMALAYIENGHHKWVSADNILFIADHGVLIRTEGLAENLIFTGNLEQNPLLQPFPLKFNWSRAIDIEGLGYGLPISSAWRLKGSETLSILSQTFDTLVIEETVSFPSQPPFIQTGLSWQNRYWFDKESQELLRSEQKFSPDGDTYNMTYLSRATRLIDAREGIPQ
ncbi:YjbF family lipoprotein [Alteromonas pelagimontana]|uniref:YjbF family lipoprotein n=2 Tax=Alteromonas pelagimontana TaxID=1858656 RepID=A0A6M4ML51_9ALTE|nr:YjbF family lipoprotein [Alteromonas pelagimontana]